MRTMKKLTLLFVVLIVMIQAVSAAEDFAYLKPTLLNQDPDPAEPGKYVELRWKVEKLGDNTLKDVTFELKEQYPFYFDDRDTPTRKLGDWTGYSTSDEFATLYYIVRVDENALEGTYPLSLRYKDATDSTWKEQEFNIRVGDPIAPEFVIGTLTSSPRKLISDIEEAEISVELENIADGNARNTKVQLDLPEGFKPSYAYADRDNLGTIVAGGSQTATFYIDIDENIKPGIHTALLNISYYEENDEKYKSTQLPLELHVMDKPTFTIESIDLPKDIQPGQSVDVLATVKNTGTKAAEAVSLRAFKESSQPFGFDEKSDYIGNLDSGETGQALLKMTVDADASPKKYILDLEIRAVDNNEVVIQDETMVITVEPDNRNVILKMLSSPIAIILIVGLFGFGVWKFSTKRKVRK